MDLEQRLLDVFESVFGPEARDITDDDGPGTIAGWDSVNHLTLILSIEAEFGVQFDTSEIPDLLSKGKIRERLADGVIVDGRNLYEPETVEAQGLKYYAIGRGRT